MVEWNSRNAPYRVRIPDYLQVPPEYGRIGLVVGERRGTGGIGPLVAVLLDGAASDIVAAVKADCTVLEGRQAMETESNAVSTPIPPLVERCLEWHGLAR